MLRKQIIKAHEAVQTEGVTHLRLQIKPDKGSKPCRATITSLIVR